MSAERELPERWKETTLDGVIKLIGGGTPKTNNPEYWDGHIPWLSVSDFRDVERWVSSAEKKITQLGLEKSSTKLLTANSLIISARGTVGALAQLKSDMTFNQSCYGIQDIDRVSNIDFLFYLIKNSLRKIEKNTHGGVFDTITKATFEHINIKLPPLPEQKAIAAILTAFDDKIELLQAQNKTLETMAQTIFKEWFGKYQVGDELPEGWRVGTLGDVAKLKSGYAFKGRNFVNKSDFKALKIKDLKGGGVVDLDGVSSIEKIATKPERVEYFRLTEGDIVLAMSGNTTGKIGILPPLEHEVFLNQRVGKFFFEEAGWKIYLYNFLMSGRYEAKILAMGYGSAQPNISPSQIEGIGVIYPSDKKLNDFNKIARPIYEKTLRSKGAIRSLKKVRDLLLPQLMDGKIKVKNL